MKGTENKVIGIWIYGIIFYLFSNRFISWIRASGSILSKSAQALEATDRLTVYELLSNNFSPILGWRALNMNSLSLNIWKHKINENKNNLFRIIPYFPAHKTHFFPPKCDLNSTCVLCAEGKCYFQTYKYSYIYYTTSLSWDSEICFQIMRSGITACDC